MFITNINEATRGASCEGSIEDGPATEEVFEEVALHSVEHYIRVWRDIIANFIRDRPIYTFCTEAERQRDSSTH